MNFMHKRESTRRMIVSNQSDELIPPFADKAFLSGREGGWPSGHEEMMMTF